MPPNTKCVTRPGRFGSPFYVENDPKKDDMLFAVSSNEEAVELFAQHVSQDATLCALIRRELHGFNLACYCGLQQPCHADVLLRIANS